MGALYQDNGMRKDESERVNRNPHRYKKIPVKWDGTIRGPELPDDRSWCQRTEEWWAMWRRSPQSMVMVESDWEEMLLAAIIHNKIWSPDVKVGGQIEVNLFAELRQRTQKYGSAFSDRLQMGMDITTPNDVAEDDQKVSEDAAAAVDYLTSLTMKAANGQVKDCMDARLNPDTARLEHQRHPRDHDISVHKGK